MNKTDYLLIVWVVVVLIMFENNIDIFLIRAGYTYINWLDS